MTQLHTFRARSLRDALRLVREELGPDASVLDTREIGMPLARWFGFRRIEVTASDVIAAPSRLTTPFSESNDVPGAELNDYRGQIRASLAARAKSEPSLLEQLASDRGRNRLTTDD